MHEDPQKRPSLQEVLNVFERQLHKYKIEPHTVEQQGMLFEYELPDKIDSISYQPSQQVFRL